MAEDYILNRTAKNTCRLSFCAIVLGLLLLRPLYFWLSFSDIFRTLVN